MNSPSLVRCLLLVGSTTLLTTCAAQPIGPLRSGIALDAMDLSVRPQDDLFRYVNGNWLARTQIPADLSDYGAFAQLDEEAQANVRALLETAMAGRPRAGSDARKAADFYASFLDTATIEARGLTPLAAEFARVDALMTPADVAGYIGYNQRLGIHEPLTWYVQQDAREATRYAVYIDQNGLTMPDRDYYLRDDARYVEYRQKFLDYMSALLHAAGQADAVAQAQTILALERRMAEAQWTRVQNRDPVATYNKWSLTDAATKAPGIDWARLLAATGAPGNQLIVGQPSFMTALGDMVQQVPVASWRSYFRYKLIDTYAPLLPAKFEQLHFGFHEQTLSGVQEQKPRWKRAVELLDSQIGEITGRMYVERHFSADSKRRMQELVANLMRAYEQSIEVLDWMGPETRAAAKRKLAAIGVKIGYPDRWRDYRRLEIRAGDLMGNVLRAADFEHQRHVGHLGKPIDRGEWSMTTPTVNARYDPLLNDILFPAAILQPPFFDPRADDAVIYGGIGAVIGHEISHGFDDQGSQFDGDGNLRNWWTPEDLRRFKERTSALVAQYSTYRVLDNQPLNGELMLGENIADLSGLAIAYKAYQLSLGGRPAPVIDGFSGAQRFFMGWSQVWRRKYRDDNMRQRLSTDPHSPSEFRANGTASNIDAFYTAFDLGPGDRLYRKPEERVRLW
jgi:predicted metalloendopeptidase